MPLRKITRLLILALTTGLLVAGGPVAPSPGQAVAQAGSLPENGVIIYQFHRRFRCQACHSLEAAINEALDRHFAREVKDGRIVFRVVDLDAEGNGHYEKDYQFFYNTVIMVDVKNGSEARFKNLEKVWELVEEPEEVIRFIRSNLEEYL